MRDHGGQIFALAKLHGIELPPGPLHDFSASLSPLGMPPQLQGVAEVWKELCAHYPSPDSEQASKALADAHGLSTSQVLCGNGSTELFALALSSLPIQRCWMFPPHWSGYREACDSAGVPFVMGNSWESVGEQEAMIVASPNNPDGSIIDVTDLKSFCNTHPRTFVLVDLAFDDFLHSPHDSPWWQGQDWPGNLIRIKSLTKFFGIPGIRLGFLAIGNDSQASDLEQNFRHRVLPWNVNGIAQWCAERLYQDLHWHQLARNRATEIRKDLLEILEGHGFQSKPCAAWVIATPPMGSSAEQMQIRLLKHGICVRRIGENQLRLGLASPESLFALSKALGGKTRSKRTPAILVAGTTSDAGKSVVALGLCAVLRKHGFHPVPYKAQNMSNHAWVTKEGGEIGWAQAMQAFAAGVEPHTDMNPILLKPGSISRSHVIVNGIDTGSCSVKEYHERFEDVKEQSLTAYDRLASRAGIVVLEGAGGIAEINLRHRDLSNREAPLHANANILIVGDIEKGGVFASLYGSWAMLDDAMRRKVCGFAINRFRGDASLLDSGIAELEQRTGVPVLGVIPFQDNLQLGEEDSMGFKESPLPADHLLRIGVVLLPHLANGNDWMSLQRTAGVGVFCSADPEKLSQADALIIPGSRSTIADLRWLRARGLDQVISTHASKRKPLFAICGGMQMLGTLVSDPDCVESTKPDQEIGLGIFPLQTILQSAKKSVSMRTAEVPVAIASEFPWLSTGLPIQGYEIHCGTSTSTKDKEGASWLDGWIGENGRQWGTYWHGILNQQDLLHAYVKQLFAWCKPKSSPPELEHHSDSFWHKGIAQMEALIEAHLDWRRLL